MKKRTIIILALGAIVIAASLYAWMQYNKKHPDYKELEIEVSVSAKQLYNDYKSGTEEANTKYLGKVTEVTGKVNDFEQLDSVIIVSFVFEEGLFGDQGVRCTMLPTEELQQDKITEDNEIRLKGICQGFNETDVILEKCSLIAD